MSESYTVTIPVHLRDDFDADATLAELKRSVNPVRLKNHPIALDEDTIDMLYHEILR